MVAVADSLGAATVALTGTRSTFAAGSVFAQSRLIRELLRFQSALATSQALSSYITPRQQLASRIDLEEL